MMTKTFKITIGILILLALAAGGVFSVSKNSDKQQVTSDKDKEENIETFKETEETETEETNEMAEEVEEITADQDIDTSNWKTYRNEEYGFELKYPGEWEIQKQENVTIFIVNSQNNKNQKTINAISIGDNEWRQGAPEGGGSIVIYDINITSDEFIKRYDNDDDSISQIKTNKNDIFAGKKVSRITAGTAIGLDEEYLIFEEPLKKPFLISYQEFDPFHKQILSTFRFLN